MNQPNFDEEKKLWKQGIEVILGIDEVGRGPLAGPVVAAAVFVKKDSMIDLVINDSKKLSEKKREELYEILTKHKDVKWGVGIVSEKVIDKINILEATKVAMQQAVENINIPAEYFLIDGNFILENINVNQKAIVKGDSKVFSIAAASIIAKVTRDRLMKEMDIKYPQYGFAGHKGYGTATHIKTLKEIGPCDIHRRSFYPVSSFEA